LLIQEEQVEILTNDELNDELDRTAAWAKNVLQDGQHDNFIPALVVLGEPGNDKDPRKSVTIAMMPDFDMARRHEILMGVGARFGREGKLVRAIFFVTEAWVSLQESDCPRKYALPEQDPDRKEVIQVAGMAYDGRSCLAQIAVTRNKRDRIIAGEMKLVPYGDDDAKVTNNICKAFFRGFAMEMMGTLVKS
jgi:hypothetical protein